MPIFSFLLLPLTGPKLCLISLVIMAFTVLQWNSCGLNGSKPHELAKTINNLAADAICLNETHLKSNEQAPIRGFSCVKICRPDNMNRGGGAAIYVRQNLKISSFGAKIIDNCECVYVDVSLENSAIRIATSYCPPGIKLSENAIKFLLLKNKTILCGDLNAKHRSFGCAKTNGQGEHLLAMMLQFDLIMLSTGQPTRLTTNGTIEDQVDVFLCSSSLQPFVSRVKVLGNHNSDHLPIIINYYDNNNNKIKRYFPEYRRDYSKANWPEYQHFIEENRDKNPKTENIVQNDIDEANKSIISLIDGGAELSIPVVKADQLKIRRFTKAIEEAIIRRNRLARLLKRFKTHQYKLAFNAAKRLVDSLFKEQDDNWLRKKHKRAQENFSAAPHLFWQAAESVIKGISATPANELVPIVGENGTLICSSQDKASAFANYYHSKVFQTRTDLPYSAADYKSFTTITSFVNGCKDIQPSSVPMELPEEDLITFKEIAAVIKSLKMKSPGEDNVHNTLIKRGGAPLINALLPLYNNVIRFGFIPQAWKEALVTLIPKPGKDPTTFKGYRPISLLSTIGKLFDKIMTARIKKELLEAGWFCPEQSGFLELHGCGDHLYRASDDVNCALRIGKETTMICLDVEAAFDTIWHPGVTIKIIHAPMKMYQKRYLAQNLQNRFFAVRVGTDISAKLAIEAGVPQGAVSSPLQFIIFTNDLFRKLEIRALNTLRKGVLADDVCLWIVHFHNARKGVKQKLENALNRAYRWYVANRLKLNADKTQVIRFTRRPDDGEFALEFNGAQLNWLDSVKYLGVVFDKGLYWDLHLEYVINKITPRITGLKRLRSKEIALPPKLAVLVYQAYVRSCIEYGAEAFATMTDTRKKQLQRFQNEALRICLGKNRYYKITKLHDEARIESIEERFKMKLIKFAVKNMNNKTLVGSEILNSLQIEEVPFVERSQNAYHYTRKTIIPPSLLLRQMLSARVINE